MISWKEAPFFYYIMTTIRLIIVFLLIGCVNVSNYTNQDLCFSSVKSIDGGENFVFDVESNYYNSIYHELRKRNLYLDKCIKLMVESMKINASNDLSIDTQFGKFEPRWNSFQSKRHLFSLIYYYQRQGLSNLYLD